MEDWANLNPLVDPFLETKGIRKKTETGEGKVEER